MEPTSTSKVKFIPLSPKSSQTLQKLQRHRLKTSEWPGGDAHIEDEALTSRNERPRNPRRRSGSDVSSNRPRVQRRRRRGGDSPNSDGGSEIEYLPDRFDSSGRPLRTERSLNDIPREGEFEHVPRDENDVHIRGAWRAFGDPDPALVSGIAQAVGGLLRPGSGLMGLLGQAIRDI